MTKMIQLGAMETYQLARDLYRNTLSDPHSLNQSNTDHPKSFPGHPLSPLLKLSIVFLLLYLSFACIFIIHYLGLSPVILVQVLKHISKALHISPTNTNNNLRLY